MQSTQPNLDEETVLSFTAQMLRENQEYKNGKVKEVEDKLQRISTLTYLNCWLLAGCIAFVGIFTVVNKGSYDQTCTITQINSNQTVQTCTQR